MSVELALRRAALKAIAQVLARGEIGLVIVTNCGERREVVLQHGGARQRGGFPPS
jgi:hypothetical protein